MFGGGWPNQSPRGVSCLKASVLVKVTLYDGDDQVFKGAKDLQILGGPHNRLVLYTGNL